MSSQNHPPLWGNFVAYADEDFLAFGLLMQDNLCSLAFYHSIQAIEKYLKSLALSIIDPLGSIETPLTQPWIKTHKLQCLANKCSQSHSYYGQSNTQNHLKRFSEFDQLSRYPWVSQKLGNGFSSDDIPVIYDICKNLRQDLAIDKDNYKLGMELRGYFHGDKSRTSLNSSISAVHALRKIFPNINELVGGWDHRQDDIVKSSILSELNGTPFPV